MLALASTTSLACAQPARYPERNMVLPSPTLRIKAPLDVVLKDEYIET